MQQMQKIEKNVETAEIQILSNIQYVRDIKEL